MSFPSSSLIVVIYVANLVITSSRSSVSFFRLLRHAMLGLWWEKLELGQIPPLAAYHPCYCDGRLVLALALGAAVFVASTRTERMSSNNL